MTVAVEVPESKWTLPRLPDHEYWHLLNDCIICGKQISESWCFCSEHTEKFRVAFGDENVWGERNWYRGYDGYDAVLAFINDELNGKLPILPPSLHDRFTCPRCEKNPIEEDDYLCRECRYGF